MDNIILTIFFLRLQTNIPFIDRILEKLSELSGGREEIVLLALFILVLLFILFIRGRIKKVKQKKALEYHIEEKDKYHISMEKKDLSSLVSLLIEGLGGKDNIKSVRFDAKKLKVKIMPWFRRILFVWRVFPVLFAPVRMKYIFLSETRQEGFVRHCRI